MYFLGFLILHLNLNQMLIHVIYAAMLISHSFLYSACNNPFLLFYCVKHQEIGKGGRKGRGEEKEKEE